MRLDCLTSASLSHFLLSFLLIYRASRFLKKTIELVSDLKCSDLVLVFSFSDRQFVTIYWLSLPEAKALTSCKVPSVSIW